MSRLFKDGAGTYYDNTVQQVKPVDFGFTANATAGASSQAANTKAFEMFAFTATTAPQQMDNSVSGEMRDCGECHVGGGMMEYINNERTGTSGAQVYDPAQRTSLRNVDFTGRITSFNAYIDIFGTDGRGAGATYGVKTEDFSKSGVLEMDCLMCHLKDYDWHARKEAVRLGKYDSSRVAGANFGTVIDGITVTYDSDVVKTDTDGSKTGTVNAKYVDLSANLLGKPATENCASCHMADENVDWKKRGDVYMHQVDTNGDGHFDGFEMIGGAEVHAGIGCMGCHERSNTALSSVGTNGLASSTQLGLCDPAKGATSPFDALWGKLDDVNFKKCESCHTATPAVVSYGAPDPAAVHAAKGLTDLVAYNAAGVAKSHIDIIDCTACHLKKTGITGGGFVDGTGADAEGRVATHDNAYVGKDMENGIAMHWLNGKMYAANLLTSIFWRDMEDATYDANADGRAGGIDGLLQTHVAKINQLNGVNEITRDGVVTPTEISDRQAMILASIGTLNGKGAPSAGNPKEFKLSALTVPFKMSHNVGSAINAKGAVGCQDCHQTGAGFYNGAYPVQADMTSFTYAADQWARFTKVNGKIDASDGHPNVMNKANDRSVAFVIWPSATDSASPATVAPANIDRAKVLYEDTFKTKGPAQTTFVSSLTAGAVPAGALNGTATPASYPSTFTGGHTLKIDTCVDAVAPIGTCDNATVTSRTWQTGQVTGSTAGELVTAMTKVPSSSPVVLTNFTNTTEYTITATDATTAGKLVITAKPGYLIKLNGATDFGPYGFGSTAYALAPITRTDAAAVAFATANDDNTNIDMVSGVANFKTRDGYVKYLDSIAAAPVAAISSISPSTASGDAVVVAKDASITFTAVDQKNPKFTYQWSFSDGVTVPAGLTATRSFSSLTGVVATLKVTNTQTSQATSLTKSVLVGFAGNFSLTTAINGTNYRQVRLNLGATTAIPAHTSIRVEWGDGTVNNYTTATATFAAPSATTYKTYYGSVDKTAKVRIFNGVTQVDEKSILIDLTP